ncbi:MAG: hypothetical protein JST73_08390 [Actinobacteria bacterium]|nr:hypothetical protein [Actinomycetota bacterium]
MYPIAVLLVVLAVSLLVVRTAAAAFTSTGLPTNQARFQAWSAFTGTGFTTSEADAVLAHPFRRRVATALMVLGKAGVAAAVGTLLLGFNSGTPRSHLWRLCVLGFGVLSLLIVARSRRLDRGLERVVRRRMRRVMATPAGRCVELLHVDAEWSIAELTVDDLDPGTGRSIADVVSRVDAVTVLGIERSAGRFEASPALEASVSAGDRLVLYGARHAFGQLDGMVPGTADDHAP